MKFISLRLLSVLLVSSLNVVSKRTYCLNFKPMSEFKMDQFYGQWYAVKTTCDYTRCLEYDFYPQQIENLGVYAAKSKFYCIFGTLEVNPYLPSEMSYSFCTDDSTRGAIKPSLVVFDTDYDSYAVIYSCTNDINDFSDDITILSRSEELKDEILKRVLHKINIIIDLSYGKQLKNVGHKKCNHENISVNHYNNYNEDVKVYVTVKYKI